MRKNQIDSLQFERAACKKCVYIMYKYTCVYIYTCVYRIDSYIMCLHSYYFPTEKVLELSLHPLKPRHMKTLSEASGYST